MFENGPADWIWALLAVAIGVAAGLLAKRILFLVLKRVVPSGGVAEEVFVPSASGPARLILPTFGVQFALTIVPVPERIADSLHHLLSLVLTAGVFWLLIAMIGAAGQWLSHRVGDSKRSSQDIRAFKTRVHLLTRILTVLAVVIGAAIVLLTIPSVRQLGASILASAGIAGIVAGFAAQSIIANMLAGLQLALTEPIRIGDMVVIDKESGTVEEINSTFVVVRLGDFRRLVVPLKYFLENRFENWTLRTADHVGMVTLYVKYEVPIPLLRSELERILGASAHWDRKTGRLQAIDTTENSVQIRIMMSAANPEELAHLRSEVREKLLEYIRQWSAETSKKPVDA